MSPPLTMCLHEPQMLIHQGLVSLLEQHSSVTLEPTAATPTFAVINASTDEALALIAQRHVDGSRVIVYGRPMTAPLALRSLDAGADGVLSDDQGIESLVLALTSNEVPSLSDFLAAEVASIRSTRTSLPSLTPREVEVLAAIADGASVSMIATDLGLAEFTVANHLQRSMSKLQAPSRSKAVERARSLGIIASP